MFKFLSKSPEKVPTFGREVESARVWRTASILLAITVSALVFEITRRLFAPPLSILLLVTAAGGMIAFIIATRFNPNLIYRNLAVASATALGASLITSAVSMNIETKYGPLDVTIQIGGWISTVALVVVFVASVWADFQLNRPNSSNSGSEQTNINSNNVNSTQGDYSPINVNNVVEPPFKPGPPQPIDPQQLDEQNEHTASMPTETIAEATGDIPAGSALPFRMNPNFVGREEEFTKLAQLLKEQPNVVAIAGMGGVGKTQLASEFAHRYGKYFSGGIHWLNFGTGTAVPTEFASRGGVAGLNLHRNFASLSLGEQVELVKAAFASPVPRLLVFDNCEDVALLEAWLPTTGGSRVIVTGKRQDWPTELCSNKIILTTLNREQSIILLRSKSGIENQDEILNSIAEELGDLPLALHVAGSFLDIYRATNDGDPQTYLNSLRQANGFNYLPPEGFESGYSPTKHDLSVARTIQVSYDRLKSEIGEESLAEQVLASVAHLAPNVPIEAKMILEVIDVRSGRGSNTHTSEDERTVFDTLNKLSNLGLIEFTSARELSMHTLVTRWITGLSLDPRSEKIAEEVILGTLKKWNEHGSGDPKKLSTIAPHAQHVVERYMNATSFNDDIHVANLMAELANITHNVDSFQRYLSAAQKIRRAILNEVLPGFVSGTRDFGALEEEYVSSQGMKREILDKVLPAFLLGDHNFGVKLEEYGNSQTGVNLIFRAYKAAEVILGDHKITSYISSSFARILTKHRNFPAAKAILDQTFLRRKRRYKNNHVLTARSYADLGYWHNEYAIYTDISEKDKYLRKALCYHARALAIFRNHFQPNHTEIAESKAGVSFALVELGNYEKAIERNQEVYRDLVEFYGTDKHLQVAVILNNIAYCKELMKDPTGAETDYKSALSILEEVQSIGDLAVDIRLNIANLCEAKEDYKAAAEWIRQGLEIHKMSYPNQPRITTLEDRIQELETLSKKKRNPEC